MAASLRIAVAVTCALVLASACQGQGLEVGYYKKSCPGVERIVRAEVRKFVYKNAGIGAGLIRLLFHDCFVQVTYARLPTMAMNAPRSKCFFDRTMDRCDTDTRRALMTHLYRDVTAPCSWTRRRRTRSRRS